MNSVVKKSTMACSLLAAFMVPASEALGAAKTTLPMKVCKVAARLTAGASIGAISVFAFTKRLKSLRDLSFESADKAKLYVAVMAIYAGAYELCHQLGIPGATVVIASGAIASTSFMNTVADAFPTSEVVEAEGSESELDELVAEEAATTEETKV